MEKGYLHCILTPYTFKICSFLHAFSISKVLFMSLIGKKKMHKTLLNKFCPRQTGSVQSYFVHLLKSGTK